MMYNVYPAQHNAGPNAGNAQYPVYNNSVHNNVPSVQANTMMCVFGNAGGGGAYGKRMDPNMATPYEYNGVSNTLGGNRGYSGRGGGGHHSTNNTNLRGGSAHRGGGGVGGGSYEQQMLPDYEVHDNQLKAPVAVTVETVVPTIGSSRLFSRPPKPIVYGSRSVVRICDAFQEGRCLAGDKCHDIHVKPEFLAETRKQMSAWLMNRENEFRQTLETDPNKTFRIFVADLKEVVEVPVGSVVFTKGLYVDPTTRAKRARGAGNHAHSHAVMQVPTNCGLYSTDPALCKWGRWCNQVHIDHGWMQSKKEEFDHWFNELQARYFSLAPDDNFTVHDPKLKMSISLPKFSIADFSRGLFQGSMKKLASVCLLYQRGKCTAGSCCNQIHVVPLYLSLAREYATLKQSPNASAEEKQRVTHEMEALRGPCVERQQREQQEAEEAAAEAAAAKQIASDPLAENNSGHMHSSSGNAEDDLGVSAALIEHVQVDEDAEPVSHPASANTSLTRRLNMSAQDISRPGGRHMNSDGSYSFNPYGSVTSLPEASASYGRAPAARGLNGLNLDNSGAMQYTPGNVQLHATGTKGCRRLVAVISPDASGSIDEIHRIDEMGTSSTVDGCMSTNLVNRHMYTPNVLRAGGGNGNNGGAYRPAVHHRNVGEPSFDNPAAHAQGGTLHPMDFDASLHFSPSPLLNFDASSTSLYRNGSTRDEEAVNNTNMRLAIPNGDAGYPGNSLSSHLYMASSAQQSTPFTASKNRFSSSPAVARPRAQRPSTSSLAEFSAQSNSNLNLSGSSHSNPSAQHAVVSEDDNPR
ncbi:hypothetical protein ABB37_04998 [Leptomonas pyrrhocoris]|uniref:C3H1-type domain-containing protein n=1 Tax=Leptomonas pyrrhocoris TaxID=157538 RepID=A0A0N1J4S7_LEPPY|nr:hypothetical protein ABB37_04998 [Leptomonas pyrrhocoris]KPA79951.1 hypothetical protein ABB37_04998 [Leptomonas pyrrhocoris]|eukprot:XP_015658390.1 hypothetical protein ABB37_04998 [Leptomonas pyrrhocoris]